MELEDFCPLIQGSSTATRNQRERTEWLIAHLARLPVPAIIEFELHLAAQRKRVDTWLMWGAAWIIMQGWCSDDGFFYFQPWLVGLGHDTFERVAGNPDSLADIPQIHCLAGRPTSDWSDDEWPEWESLNYVARNAYERATGEEDGLDNALEAQGLHRISDAAPEDDPWNYDDPDQRNTRLPRLTALLRLHTPRPPTIRLPGLTARPQIPHNGREVPAGVHGPAQPGVDRLDRYLKSHLTCP